MEAGDITGYDMFRCAEDKVGRIDWGYSVEDLIVRQGVYIFFSMLWLLNICKQDCARMNEENESGSCVQNGLYGKRLEIG